MKFSNSCVLYKWNTSCAICQSTLRKNIIKELKVFNRLEIFQRIFTNETVTIEAESHKRRKTTIKKQGDQNGHAVCFVNSSKSIKMI